MALYGNEQHSVDPKGRTSVPARFRDAIVRMFGRGGSDRVVLLPWFGQCVRVYPLREWEVELAWISGRLVQDDAESLGNNPAVVRSLVLGEAVDLEFDQHGRFVIPRHLRDEYGFDGEVLWVGQDRHLELWVPAEWQRVRRQGQADARAMLERVSREGIAARLRGELRQPLPADSTPETVGTEGAVAEAPPTGETP